MDATNLCLLPSNLEAANTTPQNLRLCRVKMVRVYPVQLMWIRKYYCEDSRIQQAHHANCKLYGIPSARAWQDCPALYVTDPVS